MYCGGAMYVPCEGSRKRWRGVQRWLWMRTRDHVVAKALGGRGRQNNRAYVHSQCNNLKSEIERVAAECGGADEVASLVGRIEAFHRRRLSRHRQGQ